MEHKALFDTIKVKVSEVVNEEFIKSTKTEKGNTQVSERVVIEKIREVLTTLGLTFKEAGSQQSKDFRDVGGIGLDIEIKKTDSPVIYFNDTCPSKDIYYIVLFTGKEYKRTPEKNIPAKLLFINGEEFIQDSPWIHGYIEELTILKDKYARGENKKNLAGIMEVYPRPTFKANISKFLKNDEPNVQGKEIETKETEVKESETKETEVKESDDTEKVIYTIYECNGCGFKAINNHPDCPACKKTFCMYAKTIEYEKVEEDGDETEVDEGEFKCEECSTVQGLNNCELCDKENECEECYGQGGDYGPGEIWVCNSCLPTCLKCGAKLYTSYDKCCGKGRSDLSDDEDEEEEDKEGFGCNNCYACVSGGSGPCVRDKEKKEKND